MKKEADGTFSYEVKSPLKEMRYQIYGVTEYRSINGTESERFEPDLYGDYRSVIPVKDGIVKIIFDPSKVLKGGPEQKVVIQGSYFDEKFYDLTKKYNKTFSDANTEMRKWQDEKKNLAEFNFDGGNFIQELMAQIDSEKDPDLKKYAELIYLMFSQIKTKGYSLEKASQYFESIEPSDPDWELLPHAFFAYRSILPQNKWKDTEEKYLKESKSKSIKMNILGSKLSMAKFSNNTEELKKLHEQIKTEYADTKQIQDLLEMFPIESAVQIGAEIPDFEVASIDNPKVKISKKNMLGKIYLIDFWATWCSPCVREMDALHKAYKKYKKKGFEIVSFSLDNSPNVIAKFREEKFPMPWKNAIINDTDGEKISKKFGASGIPMPILVSNKGIVLAMNQDLRSDNLDSTLAKYFGGKKDTK